MTLTIAKLSVQCHRSRGAMDPRGLVSDVARDKLPYELSAQLGPSLDRAPAVVRLKRLNVSLRISARDLQQGRLAAAWARAVGVSLHQALARPAGDGVICSRRYETRASYRAAMMQHVAIRGVGPCWEFPELAERRETSGSAAALALLLEEPALIGELMVCLEGRGWLDAWLHSLDEWALERIFAAVDGDSGDLDVLSLQSLLEVAKGARASQGLQRTWPVASRRQAIRLWNRLNQRLPMRGVWDALRLLVMLLEEPALLAGGAPASVDEPELLTGGAPALPRWCKAVLDELRVVGQRPFHQGASVGGHSRPLLDLLSALEDLRNEVPSAVKPTAGPQRVVQWISSDCCGVLLMLSVVRRLDWWRWVRTAEFMRFGGPRALSFLLAGVGMTLLGGWRVGDSLDPAVALLSGMFAEPDRAGMRQFFAEAEVGTLAEVTQAPNWPEALEDLATQLAGEFAARVRGFQKASRSSVVRQFVRIPGRVCIEESGLRVLLGSTPWAVALHVSGMDAALERVEWLADRRVEFSLQGL